MEAFGLYLLKSVIWLSGFTLVFLLFLKNERFFLLNRIYLLSEIIVSFLFPFLTIYYKVDLPVQGSIQAGEIVSTGIRYTGHGLMPDTGLLLLALYGSGVLFVSYMIIKQSKSVIRAIKKAEIVKAHKVKLVRTAEYTSSFSFFSYVFVNPSVTDIETEEIMNHELVHIRQMHWIDLVLVELLCILQWFNPLIWIYTRFMRQNHEYLADEVALQRTADPAVYRATLLNQIVGTPVVNLANSFNYSLNKKRFTMMKNIISSPYRKMKVFLILPVIALVLYAFAKPEYKYASVNDDPGNLSAVQAVQENVVKGVVVLKGGDPLPGATVVIRGTTSGTVTDQNGYFTLGKVPSDGSLVVSFVGFRPKVVKAVFTAGMKISMIADTVNLGTLVPPPPPPPPPPSLTGKVIKGSISGDGVPPPPPPPPSSLLKGNGPPPLIILDGKMVEIDIEKIDQQTIESINVLKDKSATDLYGEKGKNGVILITTSKNKLVIVKEEGSNGSKEPFMIVEEMPQFPGGEKAALNWISQNMKFPKETVSGKVSDPVEVSFVVTSSGKVADIKVNKPVEPSLKDELIRVFSNMPDWKPGMQNGRLVDVSMKLLIDFKKK